MKKAVLVLTFSLIILMGCISNSQEIPHETRITLDKVQYVPSESQVNDGVFAFRLEYSLTDDMAVLYAQSGPIPCTADTAYGGVVLSCKTKGKCADTVRMGTSFSNYGKLEFKEPIQICGCGPNSDITSCGGAILVTSNSAPPATT